jgi:hypothetical protein
MRDRTTRRRPSDLSLVVGLAVVVTVLMAVVALWMYWMAPALIR